MLRCASAPARAVRGARKLFAGRSKHRNSRKPQEISGSSRKIALFAGSSRNRGSRKTQEVPGRSRMFLEDTGSSRMIQEAHRSRMQYELMVAARKLQEDPGGPRKPQESQLQVAPGISSRFQEFPGIFSSALAVVVFVSCRGRLAIIRFRQESPAGFIF